MCLFFLQDRLQIYVFLFFSFFLISQPQLSGHDNAKQTPSRHSHIADSCFTATAFVFLCSAFQVDVIVELQPLEDDALLHRDVVLLLKCAKSVNWVIKTRGLVGKLDVVVGAFGNLECGNVVVITITVLRVWMEPTFSN